MTVVDFSTRRPVTVVVGALAAIVFGLVAFRDLAVDLLPDMAKSTAIIAVSIPIWVVAAFLLMYVSGLSLTIMSLGGLTLGIGLLVDNSIVVLEAIPAAARRGAGGGGVLARVFYKGGRQRPRRAAGSTRGRTVRA